MSGCCATLLRPCVAVSNSFGFLSVMTYKQGHYRVLPIESLLTQQLAAPTPPTAQLGSVQGLKHALMRLIKNDASHSPRVGATLQTMLHASGEALSLMHLKAQGAQHTRCRAQSSQPISGLETSCWSFSPCVRLAVCQRVSAAHTVVQELGHSSCVGCCTATPDIHSTHTHTGGVSTCAVYTIHLSTETHRSHTIPTLSKGNSVPNLPEGTLTPTHMHHHHYHAAHS